MEKIKENLNSILSVLLFLMVGVIAFIIGKIISFSPSIFTNDYAIVLLEMLLPIIIFPVTYCFCKIFKQDLCKIGISKKNLTKSIVVGIVVSVILVLVFGIHRTYQNWHIAIVRFIYFLVCISAVEEIVFRGFIRQNICKNKIAAYLLSGILFSISHVTFPIVVYNLEIIPYILSRSFALIIYVIIHLFLQIVYDKYQNCTGPIIIHLIIDFLGVLAF